jgi:hypothetical protein
VAFSATPPRFRLRGVSSRGNIFELFLIDKNYTTNHQHIS